MGKIRRKRARKKSEVTSEALDHEQTLVNLRKFMSRNGFNDGINLKLRNFSNTGRGVTSPKTLHENDILIEVPYNLMITYTTLSSEDFINIFTTKHKLTIHDLLTTFLIVERHKKDSVWMYYINSLPLKPPWLPALLSKKHIKLLPADLRLVVEKSRTLLKESWFRIERSINNDWTCCCCGKKVSCVLNWHSFVWGYILVNTRAVYVNPKLVKELSDCSILLSDEPCMALCPFLDMFNHCYTAKSQAGLTIQKGKLVFQIITLSHFKKYHQIFISYGGHDNIRLLVEYGFFIPNNYYDSITFQLENILDILQLLVSDIRYKFIKKHSIDECLFVNETGPSFNLKALLYICFSDDSEVKHFTSTIYNENYSQQFLQITVKINCQKLLHAYLVYIQNKVISLTNLKINSVIINFLKYRCEFTERLIKIIEELNNKIHK